MKIKKLSFSGGSHIPSTSTSRAVILPTSRAEGEGRYHCSFCSRSYLRQAECRKHERIHSGNNPYHCKLCDVHLLKPSKLKAHLATKSHIRRVSMNIGDSIVCAMCLIEYNTWSDLNTHQKSAHNIDPATIVGAVNHTLITTGQNPPAIGATDYANIVSSDNPIQQQQQQQQQQHQTPTTSGEENSINTTTSQNETTEPQQQQQKDSSVPQTEAATTSNDTTPATVLQTSEDPNANCRIITDPVSGKQRYQCQRCDKNFSGRKMFRMHLRIHNGTNPYYCPVCEQHFLKRVELRNHLKTKKHLEKITESRAAGVNVVEIDPDNIPFPTSQVKIICSGPEITYPCSHCSKKFLSKRSMVLHEKVHLGTSRHICPKCHKQFSKKIHLQYHIWSVHTPEYSFKCDVCSTTFKVPYELKKHKLVHPSSRVCKTCEKTFDSASLLTEHLKESSLCVGYKCSICECIFMDQKAYDKHIVRHNEQHMTEVTDEETGTRYSCTHCDKTFLSKKSCREHLSVHLGTSRHFCDVCNQYFAKKTHLISHQSTVHAIDRPYQCEICQASFKLLHNYESHQLSHTSNRKCKTCEQQFDAVAELKEHLRESQHCISYRCEECDMIFIENKKKNDHMRLKHGKGRKTANIHGNTPNAEVVRNHTCSICSEAYSVPTKLRQHMEWHRTGRYPHQCAECDRVFFSKWKLNRHVTTVHLGLRQFECAICAKDFKSNSALKLHTMKTHEQTTIKCTDCTKEFITPQGYEHHRANFCKSLKKTTLDSSTTTSSNDPSQSSTSLRLSDVTLDFSAPSNDAVNEMNTSTVASGSAEKSMPILLPTTVATITSASSDDNSMATNRSSGSTVKDGLQSTAILTRVGQLSQKSMSDTASTPFLVQNIVSGHTGSSSDVTVPATVEGLKRQDAVPSILSFFQSYPNVGAPYSMLGSGAASEERKRLAAYQEQSNMVTTKAAPDLYYMPSPVSMAPSVTTPTGVLQPPSAYSHHVDSSSAHLRDGGKLNTPLSFENQGQQVSSGQHHPQHQQHHQQHHQQQQQQQQQPTNSEALFSEYFFRNSSPAV